MSGLSHECPFARKIDTILNVGSGSRTGGQKNLPNVSFPMSSSRSLGKSIEATE